jgi:hypothetical protein
MVYQWFSLKITGKVFFSLILKPVVQVSQFGPQNQQLRFGDFNLKITAPIS